MLKNILAVITASVSLAGCSESPITGQPHSVNRPIIDREDANRNRDSAPGSQTGLPSTTDRDMGVNPRAATTATASGVGQPGPGSGGPESASARASSLDEAPARGTTQP